MKHFRPRGTEVNHQNEFFILIHVELKNMLFHAFFIRSSCFCFLWTVYQGTYNYLIHNIEYTFNAFNSYGTLDTTSCISASKVSFAWFYQRCGIIYGEADPASFCYWISIWAIFRPALHTSSFVYSPNTLTVYTRHYYTASNKQRLITWQFCGPQSWKLQWFFSPQFDVQ